MNTDLQASFRQHGVVCVPGLLDLVGLTLAETAFRWTLEHPSRRAGDVLESEPGTFFQDHCHPDAFPAYRPLICDTGLAEFVADLLGTRNLWLMYEQIWLKQGGTTLPTPWHQDLPYVSQAGDHLATLWINLDPVAKEDSLEFVAGSHRGPLYNPTAFDARDASAALFTDSAWPPLPDIDATRSAWPIISWPVDPGDVIIFHPAMLHGGASTRAGQRRRTISLRFFGDHAFCAARPESVLTQHPGDDPTGQMTRVAPGSLFRHHGFPHLIPS
jgi:ectoine hydroxylase-related dioxygenase (phytanoyl-CoA dioxygenase family)